MLPGANVPQRHGYGVLRLIAPAPDESAPPARCVCPDSGTNLADRRVVPRNVAKQKKNLWRNDCRRFSSRAKTSSGVPNPYLRLQFHAMHTQNSLTRLLNKFQSLLGRPPSSIYQKIGMHR